MGVTREAPSGSLALGRAPFAGRSWEADDGLRTRDLRLGKPTLYQLSYVRAGAILDLEIFCKKVRKFSVGSSVLEVEAAERAAS